MGPIDIFYKNISPYHAHIYTNDNIELDIQDKSIHYKLC